MVLTWQIAIIFYMKPPDEQFEREKTSGERCRNCVELRKLGAEYDTD